METGFKLDWAFVTTNGILYNNLFYSCEQAIREQWYKRAVEKGSWLIQVFVPDLNVEILLILTSDNIHFAYPLKPQEPESINLPEYYLNINFLKERHLEKRSIINKSIRSPRKKSSKNKNFSSE